MYCPCTAPHTFPKMPVVAKVPTSAYANSITTSIGDTLHSTPEGEGVDEGRGSVKERGG